MKYILCLIFLALGISLISAQNCSLMFEGCDNDEDSCINNKCQKCDNGSDVHTNCRCAVGSYYIEASTSCDACHPSCKSCSGPTAEECLACESDADDTTNNFEGWKYNHVKHTCDCIFGYSQSGNLNSPCKECYVYINDCVQTCPSGTKANKKYMQCESETDEDLTNDDDIFYIIVTICLLVLIIVLTILLYKYFYKMFKQIFDADKDRMMPLSEEEKLYLTNQQEIEKQRKLHEEEMERRRQEEEKRRLEEEERLRKEEEERQRRLKEEEEERRRLAEEERLRLEEEERIRRLAEEEALRQLEEERERKRKEEEERLRQEAMERERQRLKELARQAREQRKMERQMTRQSTMAANEDKIRRMREEREKILKEKQEMEDYNSRCLDDAERINSKFGDINERMERSKLRKQQTISIKQGILSRQTTIMEQKKELDTALEGIDFASALQKVQSIQAEDIVFLQNLRTPPERIRLTMEAVIMAMSNSTKKPSWDDCKKEMANMNFRKTLLTYDPESMTDKMYNKVTKEYTNNPQWNLTKINKASPAAGAFAEWLAAIVNFKKIKVENAPLFAKVKALKHEEDALQEDVDKLEGLEEEERQAEKEQSEMEKETETFKSKQATLQKQATLNLGDIKDRESKLEKLNTGNLSLEEIAESDEDEDSDDSELSPEDQEALRNFGK